MLTRCPYSVPSRQYLSMMYQYVSVQRRIRKSTTDRDSGQWSKLIQSHACVAQQLDMRHPPLSRMQTCLAELFVMVIRGKIAGAADCCLSSRRKMNHSRNYVFRSSLNYSCLAFSWASAWPKYSDDQLM